MNEVQTALIWFWIVFVVVVFGPGTILLYRYNEKECARDIKHHRQPPIT